jgi:hypothetical protein
MTDSCVHILFENPDWMPPLRAALDIRSIPYREHFTEGGTLDIGAEPPTGVFLNRMSPSSHTRGHQGGVLFAAAYFPWLEAAGRRVINGSNAFAFEVSKVKQHTALQAAGILTPRTIAVVGVEGMREAARKLAPPFITKHNQGGKGLGVQLYRTHEALEAALDAGAYDSSPDNINLLQEYIEPPEPFITRVEIVDGVFQYAIRSSTEAGFLLCPADACTIDDAFCPVGEEADTDGADGDPRFQLATEITADDPLVRSYMALMKAHRIDVAGIEFVTDAQGRRYTYDINGTTNFNSGVEARHGKDGMGAIAELCARSLRG